MSYSRRWEDGAGSDDCHGRAIWALGTVVGRSSDPGRQSLAGWLFQAGLPPVLELSSPRAWAYALLGIAEYLRAFWGDSQVQAVQSALANRLLDLFRRSSSHDWPWFEDRLTYCNARLPQALIATSEWLGDKEMQDVGVRALEWLIELQTTKDDYFAPIGSNGFYVRGGTRARFDQQPVEAGSTVSACLDARRVTGDARWLSPRAAGVRLVSGAERAAAAGLRPGDRRVPRRPARRPDQRQSRGGVDALVPARAVRDAFDRSHRCHATTESCRRRRHDRRSLRNAAASDIPQIRS